jgi:hypothetical protein
VLEESPGLTRRGFVQSDGVGPTSSNARLAAENSGQGRGTRIVGAALAVCANAEVRPTCGILPVMPEDSATPDVVELTRHPFETGTRHDLDATMGFHVPDAVWDLSDLGLGTFEGEAAIKGFLEDWLATRQDLVSETEEISISGSTSCWRPSVRETAREVAPVTSSSGADGSRGGCRGRSCGREIYLAIDEAPVADVRLAQERTQALRSPPPPTWSALSGKPFTL